MTAIDSSMTFKSFVVGAENRLAWDAARKAAERPGTAYNPLFIYSATGLGKTHLLVAIANRVRELQPETRVLYTPLERLLRELAPDPKASGLDRAEILLIDDLQFLEHDQNGHRLLFHLLDGMFMSGRQVALACDRPPIELGKLDDRLLSRFSGGLVVDIGRPVLETRRAILELRLSQLGQSLDPGVIDAIARQAIENVRQLQGALNRVLAAEGAEDRPIQPDEVDRLLADVVSGSELPWLSEVKDRAREEFSDFLSDVSSAVEEALGTPRWRETLARAILKWESEGYVTKRLEDLLDQEKPVDAEEVTARYERDVASLQSLEQELKRLGEEVPDKLALRDPDRVAEMRVLLEETRRAQLAFDDFFFDREKVVWNWPAIEDQLIESWNDGDQR